MGGGDDTYSIVLGERTAAFDGWWRRVSSLLKRRALLSKHIVYHVKILEIHECRQKITGQSDEDGAEEPDLRERVYRRCVCLPRQVGDVTKCGVEEACPRRRGLGS